MISELKQKCGHFQALKIDKNNILKFAPFIKPEITEGWLCLYDGCFRKNISLKQLEQQSKKLQQKHHIFMNLASLSIYCVICNREVTDEQQMLFSGEVIREVRQAAMEHDIEQQKVLFAGNMQYPPSFQRQKAGVCGLYGEQLNSYVGAVLQLLAHTPVLYEIAAQYDAREGKGSKVLNLLFTKICNIRSGKFRILKIHDLEKAIIQGNKMFENYEKKHVSFLQYQFLRIFSDQFLYDGPQCFPKQIIDPLPLQKSHLSKKHQTSYGPMKALFSGYFKWEGKCEICSHQKTIKSQFQCIRLQCNEKTINFRQYVQLWDLINSTFDILSHKNNPFSLENGGKTCEICKQKYQDPVYYLIDKSKCQVNLPNILLLQFGQTSQGLRINLPNQIDLTQFTKFNENESSKQEDYMYHYVGSIGIWKKKYLTHVREEKQNGSIKEYLFNSAIVKEDSSIQKLIQNKIGIYKLNPLQKNKNIAKNINSSIEVDIKCIVPLPDFWCSYLAHLRIIQPLINPLICVHGLFLPKVSSKSFKIKKIPPQIYQFLIQEFGGLKTGIVNGNEQCPKCREKLNLLKQIKSSEKQMAKFADKLSNKKNRVCIDKDWIQKWKKYLYQQCPDSYSMEGYPRPGPINNRKGVKQEMKSIDDSRYKKISPEVWYFFKKFYGGGPLITNQKVEPSLAVVQAVDLRFQALKQKIDEYKQFY